MFRVISLKIYEHPFLGTINEGLNFVPNFELNNNELPYSTVIIGQNGTGKSSLMALLIDVFEDIKRKSERPKTISKINYKYEVVYCIRNSKYKVAYNFKINLKNRRKIDEYTLIKNENKDSSLKPEDLELPKRIIAVSYLAMDRFRAKKNVSNDFYMYLGLRDRSNAARARTFINNTLPMLFDFIQEEGSISFLKSVLSFLGFNPDYLGISFEYRYKKTFFTGELTNLEFENLFETYSNFSGRTETPYGVKYFDANIRRNKKLINRLVNFINIRTFQDSITIGKKSYFDINLLDTSEALEDLELITHLRRLDLMSTASFMFKKGVQQPFDAAEASSGEFHFLTTMIAVQASIVDDSLVLIDEPETSFHPNWQMKYINNLKDLFKKWNSAHFILATHSHFLVSDLEFQSSEVIALKGSVPNLTASPIVNSTYGWSAEEILLDVFNVSTTRNHFVFEKVGEILEMIALPNRNKEDISMKVEYLVKKGIARLSKEDPLKEIIDKLIDKYGRS